MSKEPERPEFTLGPVSLVVEDLEPMIDFYARDLRLKRKNRTDTIVELYPNEKAPEPLLVLRHDHGALDGPRDAAGLYHFAILMPHKKSLAEAYLSIGKSGVVFDGYADHLVSEALYLTDPEGNGIEIYRDRPRSEWKFEDGRIQMATLPLDIDSLLSEISGVPQSDLNAFSDGASIGHVHLKVTNLERSVAFYQQLFDMNVMNYWGSAAFLSVGGYHHHIGMNTWESLSGPARERNWLGVAHATVKLSKESYARLSARLSNSAIVYSEDSDKLFVVDPDGIELLITPST